MEIRDLKGKDVRTIAGMLGKLDKDGVESVFRLIEHAQVSASSPLEVGFSLFHLLAANITDDIYNWLAELAGISREELDEAPINTVKDIVVELTKKAGFEDFLASLSDSVAKDTDGPPIKSPSVTVGQMDV